MKYFECPIEPTPDIEYSLIRGQGACMDSEESPIRIPDGHLLLIHELPLSEPGLMSLCNKVVCLFLSGQVIHKQVVYVDMVGYRLKLRQYNLFGEFWISIRDVERIFLVDGAYSEESLNS
ncbi:MAG: hypothetical protein WC319_09215 [Candidatus Paceibacterota bacterium]|jgi:hypothetical protein